VMHQKKRPALCLFMVTCAMLFVGCAEKQQAEPEAMQEKIAQPVAEVKQESKKEAVKGIAHVNGSPITQAELDYARTRTFGRQSAMVPSGSIEEKLLQSLVASRAISQAAEQELSQEQLQEIELKAAAYKEELLVKQYLTSHVEPEPVSSDMAKQYYEQHPEEFGAGLEKTFEMIRTVSNLDDGQRRTLLLELAKAKSEGNWEQWVNAIQLKSVVYKRATAKVDILDQPLQRLVRTTQIGKVSPIHNGDHIAIVRVIDEKRISPKPFSEVSAEVRKRLAPLKLKEAIKTISQEIVKNSQVTYAENNPAREGN